MLPGAQGCQQDLCRAEACTDSAVRDCWYLVMNITALGDCHSHNHGLGMLCRQAKCRSHSDLAVVLGRGLTAAYQPQKQGSEGTSEVQDADQDAKPRHVHCIQADASSHGVARVDVTSPSNRETVFEEQHVSAQVDCDRS